MYSVKISHRCASHAVLECLDRQEVHSGLDFLLAQGLQSPLLTLALENQEVQVNQESLGVKIE